MIFFLKNVYLGFHAFCCKTKTYQLSWLVNWSVIKCKNVKTKTVKKSESFLLFGKKKDQSSSDYEMTVTWHKRLNWMTKKLIWISRPREGWALLSLIYLCLLEVLNMVRYNFCVLITFKEIQLRFSLCSCYFSNIMGIFEVIWCSWKPSILAWISDKCCYGIRYVCWLNYWKIFGQDFKGPAFGFRA